MFVGIVLDRYSLSLSHSNKVLDATEVIADHESDIAHCAGGGDCGDVGALFYRDQHRAASGRRLIANESQGRGPPEATLGPCGRKLGAAVGEEPDWSV